MFLTRVSFLYSLWRVVFVGHGRLLLRCPPSNISDEISSSVHSPHISKCSSTCCGMIFLKIFLARTSLRFIVAVSRSPFVVVIVGNVRVHKDYFGVPKADFVKQLTGSFLFFFFRVAEFFTTTSLFIYFVYCCRQRTRCNSKSLGQIRLFPFAFFNGFKRELTFSASEIMLSMFFFEPYCTLTLSHMVHDQTNRRRQRTKTEIRCKVRVIDR